MLIKSVRVVNFRAIKDETLDCEKLTSLIGGNNTGKSTFLAAIKSFFEKKSKLDIDDLNDKSKPIEITLTFDNILDGLEGYSNNDNQAIKYTHNPETGENGYKIIGFEEDEKLKESQIKRAISGQFEYIFIPAVRDAANDAVEKKESLLADLIKKLVISNEEYESPRDEFEKRLKKIDTISLDEISKKISKNIKKINPGISVEINKSKPEIPKFKFSTFENGEERALNRMGHGTQRNFIWSTLMTISEIESKPDSAKKTIVMLIEEPELYQHPPKFLQLQKLLCELTGKKPIQIIYATHSPDMVVFSKAENIRLFKKSQNRNHAVTIKKVNLENIPNLQNLEKIMDGGITDGFFCSKIILVEGFNDYRILTDKIKEKIPQLSSKYDLSEMMIIPVHGKSRLLKPAMIFELFEIDVYLIWDCDKKKYMKMKQMTCENKDEKLRIDGNMENIEQMNEKLAKFVKKQCKDPKFNENEQFQYFSSDNFTCFEDEFEDDCKLKIDDSTLDTLVCKVLQFVTGRSCNE